MTLLVRNGIGRNAHANLHLLERLLIPQNNARDDVGRRVVMPIAHGLHAGEVLADQVHELLMIEVSGGGSDYVSRDKFLSIRLKHWAALKTPHSVARSPNRQAQRVSLPEILCEDFMDEIIRIVLIHFYFFQNHSTLTRNVLIVEYWIQNKVA